MSHEFGIMILLAVTAIAVIAFFSRDSRGGENAWRRLIVPALATILLAGIVVLAVLHYNTLLGVPAGDPAAWELPASYALVAAIGLAWGLILRQPPEDLRPDRPRRREARRTSCWTPDDMRHISKKMAR